MTGQSWHGREGGALFFMLFRVAAPHDRLDSGLESFSIRSHRISGSSGEPFRREGLAVRPINRGRTPVYVVFVEELDGDPKPEQIARNVQAALWQPGMLVEIMVTAAR